MERLKAYCVVNFLSDNSVEVVPATWLSEDQNNCFWPKKTPNNFRTLRDNPESVPLLGWEPHQVQVINAYGKELFVTIYSLNQTTHE